MTGVDHVEVFVNRRTSPVGEVVEKVLLFNGSEYVVRILVDGSETYRSVVAPSATPLVEVLRARPDLLGVSTGMTEVEVSADLPIADLLGILIVEDPDAYPVTVDDWRDQSLASELAPLTPEDLRSWDFEDGEVEQIRTASGYEIHPRWIRVNGERGFVVVGRDFAAVGLIDGSNEKPLITETLLEWGFYGESGGPCTWDGSAEFGFCGPRLWVFNRRGDIDPVMTIWPAPENDALADSIATFVSDVDWDIPFIFAVTGTPGLSSEARSLIEGLSDVEGQWVISFLQHDLGAAVASKLSERWEGGSDIIKSLHEPESAPGRLVYAWLNQLAYGEYQAASWNDIYAAMVGQIDFPVPDQPAPTMDERFAENLVRAIAAIEVARGWAPRVAIPEEIEDGIARAERIHVDLVALEQQIADARANANPETLLAAHRRLGLEPPATVTTAWKAYEKASAADPTHESALNDAYQTIFRWTSREASVSSAEQALEIARARASLAKKLNWPTEWTAQFVQLWVDLGGTGASAQAWAKSGWSPREVLTAGQLQGPWNAPIPERVRATEAPLRPEGFEST